MPTEVDGAANLAPLRIGILSFAHYHANFWAEALVGDPRVTLAGIWDDDPERGARAATRFATLFRPDLEALLDDVDAVAVCSETGRHRVLIERAAARRRHVLCEKPTATNLADVDAIAAAVGAAGVIFAQSFPKRLDPVNHRLKALMESGVLGSIRLVRVRHGHNHGADRAFLDGWWTRRVESGGGTLIDEGIHAADFLRWLFGDPETVQAVIATASQGVGVEDTAVALFRWADGLIGEIATGWHYQAAEHSVEIYGTAGTALLTGVDLASRGLADNRPYLKFATTGATSWTEVPCVPGFVGGRFHHAVATAFVDSVLGGVPPPAGLAEGRAALVMVLAAYRAAASGQVTRL